jgi:hypothetical protein
MSILVAAQISAQINPYSGIHDFDSCHFETPCSWIILHNDTSNIWQIGPPQKLFFDTAYSATNALVTDTINPYPISNHSYFDLRIPDTLNFIGNVILSFKHKFQTDTLIDGGYLEISNDGGYSWLNVIEDDAGLALNSENMYSQTDTLSGGIHGFSGTSEGWITTRIQWVWGMLLKGTNEDKIIRFHFISDSIQTNKAGWMIDDVLLSYVETPGGISDFQHSDISLKLVPNPAGDYINLSFDGLDAQPYTLSVFNVLGQEVKTLHDIRLSQARLDVSGFKNGMYFVQLKKEGQIVGSGKFLKR